MWSILAIVGYLSMGMTLGIAAMCLVQAGASGGERAGGGR